jgi:cell division protein ZapA (FtsZ GTPase activity inhibitor)
MKKPSIKHIPLLLLGVYLIRSLILNSVNLNEVLLIGVLAALTAFYELQLESRSIKDLNEQIKKLSDSDKQQEEIIKDFNEQIKKLSDSDKQQEEIIKDIRNIISTMKVSSGIRNVR